jgi:glyoxylase-like metal-dependent hydrolase (beta-lactamase superfamily II)
LLSSAVQAATEPAPLTDQTATQTGNETISSAPITQQVPGYYRAKLGNFQITALYDGYTKLSPDLFRGLKPQQISQLLQQKFVDSDNGIQTAVNAFLIDTGKQLVLVDSGAAKCFGETLGSIEDNMRAAGYQPAQVNAVLLTHLHPDHVCGITHQPSGEKAFTNATVYVNKTEADFWLDDKNLSQYSTQKQEKFKGAFDLVSQVLKPYRPASTTRPTTLAALLATQLRWCRRPAILSATPAT